MNRQGTEKAWKLPLTKILNVTHNRINVNWKYTEIDQWSGKGLPLENSKGFLQWVFEVFYKALGLLNILYVWAVFN